MTKFNGLVNEDQSRFDLGKHVDSAAVPGRWAIPLLGILGALVLSGYLMTGHPSTLDAAAKESSSWSMTDLLKAAVGAALALAWAVGGAWFGRRCARMPKPLDEPADDMRTPGTGYCSLRAPTRERMYDETRLVPHYLRSAKFPATKQDLVRLAREHIDEGQALRRLECIPDRRYASVRDLINEIRCD
jgi:hypothetical protein